MKAFEFRLQGVADFRQHQLDVAKNTLQTLSAEMVRLESESASLEAQRNEAEHDVTRRSDLRGEDLLALASFKEYLSRRESILSRQKTELATKIATQRTEVVEAERNVKLLGRLKDRKLQEWKSASDRELDDLAADSHLARLSSQRAAGLRTRNL